MRARFLLPFALVFVAFSDQTQTQNRAQETLDIYFIDVEGGQATLFVSPSGASLLVDAGWPGFSGRDADRIAAVARQAGASRLDYLVVTHYHRDHVGGVPELAARLPVRTFVDHGPTVEQGEQPAALFRAYLDARKGGRHLQVKPGDTIPVAGIDVQIVSSGGELLTRPLRGAGAANALCRDFTPRDEDPTENARSVGTVVTHGSFRMLNLGDLTWNKERELVCPNNLLGTFDVYLTTHHGTDSSGPAVIVHAIRPRVAVMNNGAKKGGSRQAWRIVRDAPGLEDLWQLHHAVDAGADHNSPEPFIANVDETTAHWIKISARRDGGFVVTNSRNGHSKTYKPRNRSVSDP
jgi:beta-lactamase superfamily II metal-dependent hydrolase